MPTEHRFVSTGGTPIFHRRYAPVVPQATAIIIHGMGEHGGRYAHVAEHLASHGFEALVPDLRGFGLSGGKRACIRRFEEFHEDLDALVSLVQARTPGRRVFLLGHSFGGLIVSSYAAFRRPSAPAGVVLSSPIFGLGIRVPAWRNALALTLARFFPDYSEPNRVRPESLTHDAEILKAYADDKLKYHRISARLYAELTRNVAKADSIAASLRCPTLVLQAEKDVVVRPDRTRRFFERLAAADREYVEYPGLYHEILNETSRETIFSKISSWMNERIISN